jgi:hypothetical protein
VFCQIVRNATDVSLPLQTNVGPVPHICPRTLPPPHPTPFTIHYSLVFPSFDPMLSELLTAAYVNGNMRTIKIWFSCLAFTFLSFFCHFLYFLSLLLSPVFFKIISLFTLIFFLHLSLFLFSFFSFSSFDFLYIQPNLTFHLACVIIVFHF